MKKDSSASLIGIDEDNNIVKFGKIDSTVSFDFVQEKTDIFFQENLVAVDSCYSDFITDIYYDVKYKFYCDNTLNKKNPRIKVLPNECNLNIFIFTKEACNYEKLTYDSYILEQKIFIFIIYIFFSILLLVPNNEFQFFVANSLFFIILFSSLFFNFQIDKKYFWLLDICYLSIIVFIWYFNFFILKKGRNRNKENSNMKFLIVFSVSGFFLVMKLLKLFLLEKFYLI